MLFSVETVIPKSDDCDNTLMMVVGSVSTIGILSPRVCPKTHIAVAVCL